MATNDAQLLYPRAAQKGEGRRRPQEILSSSATTSTTSTIDIKNINTKSSNSFPTIQNGPTSRNRSNSWNDNNILPPPPSVLRKQLPQPRKPNRRYTMPYPTTTTRSGSTTNNSTPEQPIIATSQSEYRRHSYIPIISSPLNPSEKLRSDGNAEDDIAVESATTSNSGGSSEEISRTISSENTNSNSQTSSSNPQLSNESAAAGSSSEKLGESSTKKRASAKLRRTVPSIATSCLLSDTQYSVESLHNLGKDYDRYPRYVPNHHHSTKSQSEGDRLLVPGGGQSQNKQQDVHNNQKAPEKKEFSPYIDDSIGSKSPFGSGIFPMYLDEKEDDDYLHDPDPLYDRNKRPRPLLRELGFRGVINVFCFFMLFLGLVIVFIVVPVVMFTTGNIGSNYYTPPAVNNWSTVNHDTYPHI